MRLYTGVDTSRVADLHTRSAIRRIDDFLRDVAIALSPSQPATTQNVGGAPTNASYITVNGEAGLSAERRLVVASPLTATDSGANNALTLGVSLSVLAGTPALTFGTANAGGAASTLIRTDATLALFDAIAPAALAATAAVGTAGVAPRRDHVHPFPVSLQSAANLATLTLTDTGTDETLTGSLGALSIRTAADTLSLPAWTGGGKLGATVGTILGFSQTSTNLPGLTIGCNVNVTINDSSSYTGATFKGVATVCNLAALSGGGLYTNAIGNQLEVGNSFNSSLGVGPNTFATLRGIRLQASTPGGSGTTVTDAVALDQVAWVTFLSGPPVYTNAYCGRFNFPTLGGTIRRGIAVLAPSTSNIGTEATDAEMFFADAVPRGTTNRTAFKSLGATTGTPTNVRSFWGTAHSVGTNRWGLQVSNKIENDTTDVIASASAKGFIGQYSDQAGRYFRLRALYNGGAPAFALDDVGTTLPTA